MNRPLVRLPLRTAGTAPVRKWFKWGLAAAFLLALAAAARFCQVEIETSRLQARYLSELTRDVGFSVADGPSHSIRFPQTSQGPYDSRLGYALLPSIQQRLLERGFEITSQARSSERMLSLAARSYDAVPLGYFGIDIVLDAARGPVILEMNARPGLSIQLATGRGLRPLLDRVASLQGIEETEPEVRIETGKALAAQTI